MRIKVIINGAQGKMGAQAVVTIKNNPLFELVATLGRNDNLPKAIHETQAQIVVDLTTAECVYKNALAIIESNVHPVIGTSGLLPDEINHLKQISEEKKLGGIIAPNFSLGAILMMKFAQMAANYFQAVEIIESHHEQKIDAPSQTALKTATMISEMQTDTQTLKRPLNTKETVAGVRGGDFNNIKIHSLRMPGVLAKQEVIFGNLGETLSIVHNTIDRQCFMPGITLACEKVTKLDSLHYGLESILHL